MAQIKIMLNVRNLFLVDGVVIEGDPTTEEFINCTIENLFLRWTDRDNNPINYYLERNSDGKLFEAGRPLIDQGLRDGDVLILKTDVVVAKDNLRGKVEINEPPPDKSGQVTVQLKLLDANKTMKTSLDKHLPIAEVLKQIISNYKLPIYNSDGKPHTYFLTSEALGKFLERTDTLASVHIPSGDTLIVTRTATAGAVRVVDARDARLQKEYSDLSNFSERGSRERGLVHIEPVNYKEGCPVEEYIITFKCIGITDIKDDLNPVYGEFHQIKMTLGAGFPVDPPTLRFLTLIWHPNIMHFEPRAVCFNPQENWWIGRRLVDLVRWLGEMVQYRHYHAISDSAGFVDSEVATWVKTYAEPRGIISKSKPVDTRSLLPPLEEGLLPEARASKISFDPAKISRLYSDSGLPSRGATPRPAVAGTDDSASPPTSQKAHPMPADLTKKISFDHSKITPLPGTPGLSVPSLSSLPAEGESAAPSTSKIIR